MNNPTCFNIGKYFTCAWAHIDGPKSSAYLLLARWLGQMQPVYSITRINARDAQLKDLKKTLITIELKTIHNYNRN